MTERELGKTEKEVPAKELGMTEREIGMAKRELHNADSTQKCGKGGVEKDAKNQKNGKALLRQNFRGIGYHGAAFSTHQIS